MQPVCPFSSPNLPEIQPEAWCHHLKNENPPQRGKGSVFQRPHALGGDATAAQGSKEAMPVIRPGTRTLERPQP